MLRLARGSHKWSIWRLRDIYDHWTQSEAFSTHVLPIQRKWCTNLKHIKKLALQFFLVLCYDKNVSVATAFAQVTTMAGGILFTACPHYVCIPFLWRRFRLEASRKFKLPQTLTQTEWWAEGILAFKGQSYCNCLFILFFHKCNINCIN